MSVNAGNGYFFFIGGRKASQNLAFSMSFFNELGFEYFFILLEGRWDPFGKSLHVLLDLTSNLLVWFCSY